MPEVGAKPLPKTSRVDRPSDEDGSSPAAATPSPTIAAKAAREELPRLPDELDSKPKIMAYLNQYGFGAKECENLYRTPTERAALEQYHKSRSVGRVPDEYFIAALRLSHSGRFPINKPECESLDTMQIG